LEDLAFDTRTEVAAVVMLTSDPVEALSAEPADGFARELTVASIGTAEMGGRFAPAEDRTMETGFVSRAHAQGNTSSESDGEADIEVTNELIEQVEEVQALTDEVSAEFDTGYSVSLDLGKTTLWNNYGYDSYDIEDSGEDIAPPTLEFVSDNDSAEPPVEPEPVAEVEPEPAPATPPPAPEPSDYTVRGLPDTTQRFNECAPTAIANSFQWLAKEHGFTDKLPANTEDLIDELKGYTEWDGGTKPGNSMKGKQAFIKERGLPLEAHTIGVENDPDIHRKIFDELKKGQMVEVSLQFYKQNDDGEWVMDGAHLATVSGVADYTDSGGNLWLMLHDPATNERDGERTHDTYSVEGNRLPQYWSGGRTEIRTAYAQSPVFDETGSLIEVDPSSHYAVDENGLVLPGQTLTSGMSKFGFFNVDFEGVGDHYVGDSFTTSVVVRSAGKEQRLKWSGESYTANLVGPWNLKGGFKGSGNLATVPLENRPPTTRVQNDRYSLSETFTCISAGPAHLEYTADLSWASTGNGEVPNKIQEEYGGELVPADIVTVRTPTFRCLEREPEETQTETSTGGGMRSMTAEELNAINDSTSVVASEPLIAPAEPEISFAHVAPGEYSEVYVLLSGGTPGEEALVELSGPGVVSDRDQFATYDENGQARFVWRINLYGTYVASQEQFDANVGQDVDVPIAEVLVN
jgi:hypothetical protein